MTRLALAASLMLALFGAGCIRYHTESPVLVGTDVRTGKPVILDNPKCEASKTCYWDIAPVAGSPGSTICIKQGQYDSVPITDHLSSRRGAQLPYRPPALGPLGSTVSGQH